eukprot:g14377.t1
MPDSLQPGDYVSWKLFPYASNKRAKALREKGQIEHIGTANNYWNRSGYDRIAHIKYWDLDERQYEIAKIPLCRLKLEDNQPEGEPEPN